VSGVLSRVEGANSDADFRPHDVCDGLYRTACKQACREGLFSNRLSILVLPSGFARMVRDAFNSQARELKSHSMNTTAALHRGLLSRFAVQWMRLRSDDTCFVCLRRRPQYGLPCGHCICDNCPRVFGERSKYDPWLFTVRTCFLCRLITSGVEVKYLPESAGVRVLTLDGGGVRGIAILQYLRSLQDRIGLLYPVQENFDLVYGTSSGGPR
jgi:hypothetical protein